MKESLLRRLTHTITRWNPTIGHLQAEEQRSQSESQNLKSSRADSVARLWPKAQLRAPDVGLRVQKLKNLEFKVWGQEAFGTGERCSLEDSSSLVLPRFSASFYPSFIGTCLDGAHPDWGWVYPSQSINSNVNLLWQHPQRHTQEQYFASFSPIKLTLSINYLLKEDKTYKWPTVTGVCD